MSQETKDKAAETGLKWLNHPAVYWIGGGVIAYFLLKWTLPDAFDFIKRGVNGFIDGALNAISSILGRPSSQDPSQRTAFDSVRGLFVQGDRAASDLVDTVTLQGTSDVLTDYAERRKAQLISLGYMDQAGNLTPAGLAAAKAGTIPPL